MTLSLSSENINELAMALSKAQGEMATATKDRNNSFFSSKYADLSSVWGACREPLSKNELAVVQTMNNDENKDLFLVTTLIHSSGQWMRSNLPCKIKIPEVPELDKNGKPKKINEAQLLGSLITYLRRYALSAIVGIAPDEDDDANSQSYQPQHNNKNNFENKHQEKTKNINHNQCLMLKEILKDCSPEYNKTIDNFIKTQELISLDNLPIEVYPRILNRAIKERIDYLPILKEKDRLESFISEKKNDISTIEGEAVNE